MNRLVRVDAIETIRESHLAGSRRNGTGLAVASFGASDSSEFIVAFTFSLSALEPTFGNKIGAWGARQANSGIRINTNLNSLNTLSEFLPKKSKSLINY